MQNKIQNLAILIATKDRHVKLQKLLDSIHKSTKLPNKIVIVYSGRDVKPVSNSFQDKLDLELINSELASQMFQKSIGITTLGNSHQWVLFLDDDVVLESTTIERLFIEYLSNPRFEDCVGFGLSILNRSTREINSITLGILKFFSIYSNIPGTVTKSGHAQSYLDHPVDVEVKWLNGISVWKSSVLYQYPKVQANSSYSAYEDVDFSYKVGKNNKLVFGPKARVINQKIEGNIPLTINQFISGAHQRCRFVCTNYELSMWWLLIAQFIRGLDFIIRPNRSSTIFTRIKVALKLWIEVLIFIIKNKNFDQK
jgi:hypothetical protein